MAEGSSKPPHPATPIIILLAVMLILSSIVYRLRQFLFDRPSIRHFFHQLWLFLNGEATLASVVGYTGSEFLIFAYFVFKVLAVMTSFVMVLLLFHVLGKLKKVNEKLWGSVKPPKDTPAQNWEGQAAVKYVNPKWNKVQEHINSKNPSDWKLAILEADIILDEMLDKMGYHGMTIGEKLKMVEQSDFTTINSAWEAHKIRNSIAHEGSDFLINQREAERVIALFKEVFEEFRYI